MILNKSLTIVALSTDKANSTLKAIEKSAEIFPFFDKKLLLSNFDSYHGDIEIKKVPVSSYEDYNRFMIEKLNDYINTDFALIVQDDGYIINPHLWKNKFLNYDYLGAPWPWTLLCGNGGFSLRSKKLLEVSSKLKYIKDHYEYDCCPEDSFICSPTFKRKYFEENDIKFGDLKTALEFSFEHPIYLYPNHTMKDSFGFHGKFNL
jgi:hypothetical protein